MEQEIKLNIHKKCKKAKTRTTHVDNFLKIRAESR